MPLPEFKSGNPGDWAIADVFRGGPIFLTETQLEEPFWLDMDVTGDGHYRLTKDVPPCMVMSALGSPWKFFVKHRELKNIVEEKQLTQFEFVEHGGGHSHFLAKQAAEFLLK
jgi:hypothetical protein